MLLRYVMIVGTGALLAIAGCSSSSSSSPSPGGGGGGGGGGPGASCQMASDCAGFDCSCGGHVTACINHVCADQATTCCICNDGGC